MEFLPKYLNELSDTARGKRLSAYRKLSEFCSNETLGEMEEFDLLRSCLRGFEDTSERCREYAIMIVTQLLPRQKSSVLDWVLPAIVTRIGLSPVVEESEELRLLLLKLAVLCMETFPHEIGPRNYIDFFQVLLENCLRDAFPDLKKEACRACVRLCEIEPVQVKHITLPLSKVVKSCLLHKHSLVRVEAVRTLAALIQRGAAEILSDGRDEPENRTTTNVLFVLANDHVETVRLAVVQLLSVALLDIIERQEQHRRLLPHLLLLMTDRFDSVSVKACEVLESMGKLFMIDNEDNSIDISKRRVTMKDIEWYGDEEYPDMNLSTVDTKLYHVLQRRPSLGARYVVAESLRSFIERILADVTAIDWVIPFSSNNRRVIALRILWMCIYHAEKSVVQLVEHILGVLYKSLREDNQDVVQESLICLEILGKFLTPDQYLPFLIAKDKVKESDEDRTVLINSRSKTVVVSSVAGGTTPTPTIFSTAAVSVKCSILVSFRYLIMGSRNMLTALQATQIVKALTCNDLLESDSEALLCSLLETLDTIVIVLGERGFVPTPMNPLPTEVLEDLSQRTLDSILFYALLRLRSSDFPSLQTHVSRCIKDLSNVVTGDENGIYDLHIGRILFRYGTEMPVGAFADLVLNSKDVKKYAEQLSGLFLVKLADIDFTKRVTEELNYMRVLDQLLWQKVPVFSASQLEELLRVIILPLSTFRPGGSAHLFRKVAVSCLCAILEDQNRCLLFKKFEDNEFALSSNVVTAWCSASDADDAEMRLVCMTAAANISRLPLNMGSANDIIQSILLRFDDSSDLLRAKAASGLLKILETKESASPIVIDGIIALLEPLVKKILIHLDDSEEMVGLRPILVNVAKNIAILSPSLTADLIRASLTKQQDASYCEEVLQYIESL
ncbi:HEAT repeat containing 2 [Trypanosoma theileri]|uniref:HEAT repeat containing 2 n=1 Tax=Trypanosoma theileri TaxID=67003 RepID=A0A1X0NM76_9TRYP|nr:HEAT repeat containing 2 [Trypanosoma theileri]ORC85787.1 HEAT repeat containing 2 [Trypanosoma theileri]